MANDFVERTFSIVKNLWAEERNLLGVNVDKAEFCMKLNFNMSCLQCAQYALTDRALLNAAKSNEKYKFMEIKK